MSKREIIRTELFNFGDAEFGGFDLSWDDFMRWLNAAIETVPLEHRALVRVRAEGYSGEYFSDDVFVLVADYEREETDEEIRIRIKAEKSYAIKAAEDLRQRDLAERDRLVAKYGIPTQDAAFIADRKDFA